MTQQHEIERLHTAATSRSVWRRNTIAVTRKMRVRLSSKARTRLKPSSVLFGMRDILPAKSPGRSCLSASEADSTASARCYHRSCPPPAAFPPPWSVEEQAACFVVRDRGGQALAYVYFEDAPGRRSAAKPRLRRGRSRSIWQSCR